MITQLTDKLRSGQDLSAPDVAAACDALFDEAISITDRAAFLGALHAKGETPPEITAFVHVLLDRAIKPDLGTGLLDVCGTGGDKAGLFNVSTAVLFVATACGARVVKHGNRGITSKCGGADVLEALGVDIDLPPEASLAAAGCCFLFAPTHHPTFKNIAPVRKELASQGQASIFNMLGPLLNPARPDFQLAGVFSPTLLPTYAEVFVLLGRKRAWAVHGTGGLDEVSTFGPTEVYEVQSSASKAQSPGSKVPGFGSEVPGPRSEVQGSSITRWELDPAAHGLLCPNPADLLGGTAAENAKILTAILDGSLTGPKSDIVALNAACALVVAGVSPDVSDALVHVRKSLSSGEALRPLRALQTLSAKAA